MKRKWGILSHLSESFRDANSRLGMDPFRQDNGLSSIPHRMKQTCFTRHDASWILQALIAFSVPAFVKKRATKNMIQGSFKKDHCALYRKDVQRLYNVKFKVAATHMACGSSDSSNS